MFYCGIAPRPTPIIRLVEQDPDIPLGTFALLTFPLQLLEREKVANNINLKLRLRLWSGVRVRNVAYKFLYV